MSILLNTNKACFFNHSFVKKEIFEIFSQYLSLNRLYDIFLYSTVAKLLHVLLQHCYMYPIVILFHYHFRFADCQEEPVSKSSAIRMWRRIRVLCKLAQLCNFPTLNIYFSNSRLTTSLLQNLLMLSGGVYSL